MVYFRKSNKFIGRIRKKVVVQKQIVQIVKPSSEVNGIIQLKNVFGISEIDLLFSTLTDIIRNVNLL